MIELISQLYNAIGNDFTKLFAWWYSSNILYVIALNAILLSIGNAIYEGLRYGKKEWTVEECFANVFFAIFIGALGSVILPTLLVLTAFALPVTLAGLVLSYGPYKIARRLRR